MKREDVGDRRVELQARQRPRRTRELQARLLQMIEIEVRVAERVNKFARLIAGHLRHHDSEQRIGSNVERHAEKHVG